MLPGRRVCVQGEDWRAGTKGLLVGVVANYTEVSDPGRVRVACGLERRETEQHESDSKERRGTERPIVCVSE